MIGYEGKINGYSHPKAHKGKYYFMTGWPGTDKRGKKQYLYQDVDISSYIGATITFGSYLGGIRP